jgi:hypothetical protein
LTFLNFEFPADGRGVRSVDGEVDDGHALHALQHLLQTDPGHLDRHCIRHSPLTPILRVPGSNLLFRQIFRDENN